MEPDASQKQLLYDAFRAGWEGRAAPSLPDGSPELCDDAFVKWLLSSAARAILLRQINNRVDPPKEGAS